MRMTQKNKIATVFGGTGFIGRQVVRAMAAQGFTVKIATRIPEKAALLKHCGTVGQVVPVACDYRKAETIARAVEGSDYVVNCIGILFERGKKKTFKQAHTAIPEMIAKACKDKGVKRFVHISALGCDVAASKYAKSKLEGEKAVQANFPRASILRPSVVFGAEDDFFNMFAELSRYLPFLPAIGGGKTKFQPVYVGDVARAVMVCLNAPGHEFEGRMFQLGGVDVLTFRDVYEKIFTYTGRRRKVLPLPFFLAKMQARFLSLLPRPLLTPDQVESLKVDNVVADGAFGLKVLGIEPVSLDAVLPEYLAVYRKGGRFSQSLA